MPQFQGQGEKARNHSQPSVVPSKTLPVCSRQTIANCLEAIRPHASALENLHERVSKNPLDATKNDFPSMQDMISTWVDPEITICILSSLPQLGTTEISGFRASVIYSLTDDDSAWPVLEWREGTDTEVLAILYVDDDDAEVCSWLMHYGVGQGKGTKRWQKSWISWSVGEIGHLKSLFGAARHLLGVLGWSVDDILKLYCKRDLENTSTEE